MEARELHQESPGPRAALKNRNYQLYLGGQIVSQSGGWMARIAQAWLVLELTDSPAVLGTVVTLQFLPILLLSLFAGALADRYPKRRTLLVLQTIAMAQAFALGFLVAGGLVEMWHIYVLAAVLGLTTALEQPLRQAFPAELVGRELIPSAVALSSATFSTARILGPALGGAVVAVLGVAGAFFLNGVSYIAVIVTLALMRLGARPSAAARTKGNAFSQIGESIRYARSHPTILFTLCVLSCLGTFGFNYSTFLPLVARYELQLGSSGYGTLSAALGVGAVAGALVIARLGYDTPYRQVAGGIAFSLLLAAFALSPWLGLSLLLLPCLGVAGVFFTTTANTTLQLEAPDEMRGRMMGLYTLLLMGMTPPGATITGWLADLWGIRTALALEALICLVGVLVGWRYLSRSIPGLARGDAQTYA
jgi:MFS family permease